MTDSNFFNVKRRGERFPMRRNVVMFGLLLVVGIGDLLVALWDEGKSSGGWE